jgi:hypothetical protein
LDGDEAEDVVVFGDVVEAEDVDAVGDEAEGMLRMRMWAWMRMRLVSVVGLAGMG